MASGTGVLASEAGAWKEIIREGIDGHIVPCDDVESTTKQMDRMLSDIPTLHEMGMNGRKRVEETYNLEREARSLCDYLLSLQDQ